MADDSYGLEDALEGSLHGEDQDEEDKVPARSSRQLTFPSRLSAGTLDKYDANGVRERALAFGTKAVAVSSNKPLTSKFRGVCWNKKNKVRARDCDY